MAHAGKYNHIVGQRTAIVHYWLLNMRGGERALERLCELLPGADIFTLFYDPDKVSPFLRSHKITASFLNPLKRFHRHLLPLMPLALEQFDLRGYDLVVSSESGPAKGVITSATTRHVCYCHTPMRYLWDLYPMYQKEVLRTMWKRVAAAPVAHYLRMWDYATSARVDEFVANSVNTQRRIRRAYRRDSRVVYPPVPVETFCHKPHEDYYLIVSELVPYKDLGYAISFFSRTGRKLKVVGTGELLGELRRLGGRTVEFCGRVPDDQLRDLYSRCRAFLMPGEEDFGMTAVEAQASGKPVIALGRGGVLESVTLFDPAGGIFFQNPDEDCLREAIERFEAAEGSFDPAAIQASAGRFSTQAFDDGMREILFPNNDLRDKHSSFTNRYHLSEPNLRP
jgi:glycosyltransferase involved in cell wall biosynthesis